MVKFMGILIIGRRWVIKLIAGKFSTLQEIVTKESELVEKIAEVYIQLRNCVLLICKGLLNFEVKICLHRCCLFAIFFVSCLEKTTDFTPFTVATT